MKVKIKSPFYSSAYGLVTRGTVLDVPDCDAVAFIESGQGEKIVEAKKATPKKSRAKQADA